MGVKNRERRRAKKHRDRAEANRRAARQPGRGPTESGAGPPDDHMARAAVLATAEAFRFEPEAVYRSMLAGLAALDLRTGLVDRAVAWAVDLALDRAWDSGWQPADVPRVLARKLGKAHAAAVSPAVAASASRRPECADDERWAAQVAAIPAGDQRLDLHAASVDRALAVEALSLVLNLPVLPRLSPPSSGRAGGAGGSSVAVLDRVRALLAKAESTTFPEEAEAFTAKAQEMMARHAIDEALLEDRSGAGPSPVVGCRIGVDDPYAEAKAHLLGSIARANRCRSVWSRDIGVSTVFGVRTDLRVVELMFTSLLVQGTRAMLHAGRSVDRSGRTRTRSFRQSFLLAFATRIGERLEAATAAVVEDAAAHHDALLPVLAGRAEAVDAAVDDAFPELEHRAMAIGNPAGWSAGRAAADVASLSVGDRLAAGGAS